jgi:hypothetical protein
MVSFTVCKKSSLFPAFVQFSKNKTVSPPRCSSQKVSDNDPIAAQNNDPKQKVPNRRSKIKVQFKNNLKSKKQT